MPPMAFPSVPSHSPLSRVQKTRQGLVRSIGVSNFSVAHLDKLATTAMITPAVNQVCCGGSGTGKPVEQAFVLTVDDSMTVRMRPGPRTGVWPTCTRL